MISNIDTYLSIAEEAQAEAERLETLGRRPKPDGEPGFILTFDPDRKSFKHALIAIAFAGMFLEAAFFIVGAKRFGKTEYKEKHDFKKYEDKIKLFGLADPETLSEAEHFRLMRNDLLHEKAIEFSEVSISATYVAQAEAKRALSFVRQIAAALVQFK